ncbi:hypothetical protein BO71DRAFT_365262 [Aspergillus ellipticus CBS 707.79]|uniref:Cutinase n=1 Tax=Aspergillus ellipticus CBS 707.79 TaxID=1448320 RepID=A0A319CT49_9EURO|nr:hypothetical protein BO71DRAFT_365262 [Aspergillus ellipticus CBS 707.79]
MTKALADSLLQAIPGSKAIAIDYPAARNYINNTYDDTSVRTGVQGALKIIKDSGVRCPLSEIVLLGYSQGAHVLADLLCNTDRAGYYSMLGI